MLKGNVGIALTVMQTLQARELRKRTDSLPDDYFVVLVGDMITEEALPTYMAMLNTLDGARDETGASPTPWGRLDIQPCKMRTE